MKFKITTMAIEAVMSRIYKKIMTIAEGKKWSSLPQLPSLTVDIHKSIDQSFVTRHCLITGLYSKYLKEGRITEIGLRKVSAAVKGGMAVDVEIDSECLEMLVQGRALPIRTKTMKWTRMDYDRIAYLVEIDKDVTAGSTFQADNPVYNRINVSLPEEKKEGIGGEWLTRQFLRPSEVEMFTRIQRQNTDIVLAGLRGLPRVLELDNGILRAVRKHFDELTGAEKCSWN